MPNYDVNSVLQFGRLKEFGQKVASEISAVKTVAASAIKSADIVDSKLKFWTNTTKTGEAVISLDLPSELYLDQIKTTFIPSFTFNAETYSGATNPSLDGKPVLVMRDTTERPEGIDAGTLKLVGTEEETIYREFTRLLDDKSEYEKMSKASNPYGDGHASEHIADILEKSL